MAISVALVKEKEDEEVVIYRYGPFDRVQGRLEYNKKSRLLYQLNPVSEKNEEDHFYYRRAGQRLARELREMKDGSNFPDEMVHFA
ncbi:hypothetical protein [Mechercharimyces sp. CAU 1602]|uniref:hypothetical protein n=1 Tax=Mechercharimyces sp. CAU 1602 TaxID=2973933 RepID=UPI0021627CEB|nr:hypothetical protein [Mechercharimyces sp. CAU 1602]MCS1351405.1 hypothetical protein [Mechercharimyces sp. CAU 1602]